MITKKMKNIDTQIALLIFTILISPFFSSCQKVNLDEAAGLEDRITLTSPNGGESWQRGSTHEITWQTKGGISKVNIEVWKTGEKVTDLVTGLNGQSYTWQISQDVPSGSDIRIVVRDANDSGVYDRSDNQFTLTSLVTVLSPNGEEEWPTGDQKTITWTADANISNVDIELIKDGIQVDTLPNDGSFAWDISDTRQLSSKYRIRIVDAADPNSYDASDNNFYVIFYDDFNRVDSSQDIGNNWSYTYAEWYTNAYGGIQAGIISNVFVPGYSHKPWPSGDIGVGRIRGRDYRNLEVYDSSKLPYEITFLFKPHVDSNVNYGRRGYFKVLLCNTDMESTGAVNGIGFGLMFADTDGGGISGTGEGYNEIEVYNTGSLASTDDFTFVHETWYNVKAYIDSTSVKVKVWTGTEPPEWTVNTSISNFSPAGNNLYLGFSIGSGSTNTGTFVAAYIDNLKVKTFQ